MSEYPCNEGIDMQIGRMKNEKEAQDYIQERLLEVKEILDDIAYQMGVVYMCLSGDAIRMFGRLGNVVNDTLIDIMRIIPDRIEMANTAMDIAYKTNEETEKKNAAQGDLFSQKGQVQGTFVRRPQDAAQDQGASQQG